MAERTIPIFPTPVYVVTVPEAPALNTALAEAIRRQRATGVGVSKSNVGGWQSDIDMLSWGGSAAARLAELTVAACGKVSVPIDASRPPRWQPEMWANVNRAGASNQNHWHPGSYLSFVYYVDDGYHGSHDKKLGGELVFVDPRMPFLRMRTPYLRQRQSNGLSEEHETWIRPTNGLLIGFPSFVPHSVRPYSGLGERISIAINVSAEETA